MLDLCELNHHCQEHIKTKHLIKLYLLVCNILPTIYVVLPGFPIHCRIYDINIFHIGCHNCLSHIQFIRGHRPDYYWVPQRQDPIPLDYVYKYTGQCSGCIPPVGFCKYISSGLRLRYPIWRISKLWSLFNAYGQNVECLNFRRAVFLPSRSQPQATLPTPTQSKPRWPWVHSRL